MVFTGNRLVLTLGLLLSFGTPCPAELSCTASANPARALEIIDNIPPDQIVETFCHFSRERGYSAQEESNCRRVVALIRERFEQIEQYPNTPLLDLPYWRQLNHLFTQTGTGFELLVDVSAHKYRGYSGTEATFGFQPTSTTAMEDVKEIAELFYQISNNDLFVSQACPSLKRIDNAMADAIAHNRAGSDFFRWLQSCRNTHHSLAKGIAQCLTGDAALCNYNWVFWRGLTWPINARVQSPDLVIPYTLLYVAGIAPQGVAAVTKELIKRVNQTTSRCWRSSEQRDRYLFRLARSLLFAHIFTDGNTRTSIAILNMMRLAMGLPPWKAIYQPNLRSVDSAQAAALYRRAQRRSLHNITEENPWLPDNWYDYD